MAPMSNETPYLFDVGREARSEQRINRRFTASGLVLGTSAFSANGWQSTFYPAGMKSGDYLKFYGTQFQTVEVDSTFYGTPSAATVEKWYEKTPPDFVFAAKVPQVITHEKVLVDCDSEFEEFVKTMEILGPKLGPLVFQFPFFYRWKFPNQDSFLAV